MKNIHLIPTDKPSRLYYSNHWTKLYLQNKERDKEDFINTQHIYITSDKEIKEEEYYLGEDNNIYCLVTTVNFNGKKIILTTDLDLIENGIQVIDDEFLEWFVKNPSCEEVEVIHITREWNEFNKTIDFYKIIIPKEESKQETLEEITKQIQNECHEFVKSVPNVNYQDATNTFLFMKLAELTLKLKNYDQRNT